MKWRLLLLASLFSFAHLIAENNFQASYSTITQPLQERMCYSWKENNPVPLEDLRYVTVSHWGFDGEVHQGELVVHKQVAFEVVAIFEALFKEQFPIEKMVLIDAYQADDDASMADNNSSAFCSRPITGRTDLFSNHSYGIAIDINPKINPYVKGSLVLPASGKEFADRSHSVSGMIVEGEACYRIFKEKGWVWGGDWASLKDYQHFEKELE